MLIMTPSMLGEPRRKVQDIPRLTQSDPTRSVQETRSPSALREDRLIDDHMLTPHQEIAHMYEVCRLSDVWSEGL